MVGRQLGTSEPVKLLGLVLGLGLVLVGVPGHGLGLGVVPGHRLVDLCGRVGFLLGFC